MTLEAKNQFKLPVSRCTKHDKAQDRTNSVGEMTISVDEILSAESVFVKFQQGDDGTDHMRWKSLTLLAQNLRQSYEHDIETVLQATMYSREALELCPEGHPLRSTSLYNVALHLSDYYQRLKDMTDLNEAIILGREALNLLPSGHPLHSASLNNVASYLSDRYNGPGKMTGLKEAIILGMSSNNIASYLCDRYDRLGDVTDLNEAIILGRQALDLHPSGHPLRSGSLNNLADYLSSRYKLLGDMADLHEAIIFGRQALDLRPPGHPDRSISLTSISIYLSERYNQLGDMTDLNEAIIVGRQALDLQPWHLRIHSTSLDSAASYVASYLSDRYKRLGDITDLNEAITLGRYALGLEPHSRCCSIRLNYCYDQVGDMTDLNEAIILGRQALDLRPSGHPLRSTSLNNVAIYLSERYNKLGDMMDLNEAIILGRQALDLCPSGHPLHSLSLNNIAICLCNRYNQLGEMTDLSEAIILGRQALYFRPSGHPLRSSSLNNVAGYLCNRYERLGDLTDLNEAIILGKQTLDLGRRPDHSTSLNNVAGYLSYRYERLGDMTDLNEAINLGRQALDLCRSGYLDRSMSLNNVAHYLSNRYKRFEGMTDLNEAIILGRQALDLCPQGHPYRSTPLNSVAGFISDRYNRLGKIADLDEAIILGRQALDLCPPGHPDRSWTLHQLAGFLRVQFTQSRKLEDKEDLFSFYVELANLPQMVSLTDLTAAKEWISVAEDFGHPTTVLAYETSLRLLVQHLATLPSLPHHLQIFKDRASSLAIDAFSACLRNCCAKKAVELLEQGRGVFWNQIARLRSPLEDVIASGQEGKARADEFTRLSSEIRDMINSRGPDRHDRLCTLNVDLQSVITKIRKLPGLARFLLPPSFSELQYAASGGPVVIVNATQYTCDALVVFFDRDSVHIPLQIMKSRVQDLSSDLQSLTCDAKLMDVGRDLACFLRILWDEVVSPIAEFLQTTVPPGSRIWWCPTAEFCLLPLHAANPYRKGQRSFSDLYISSYTPTLTALIRGRRNDPSATSSMHEKRFLGVGQANAEGESKLYSVGSELAIVAERIQGLATFIHLDGPESNMSQVSKELKKSEWVHFACHGIPNRKQPFDSAFGLHDGHFTVERIMGCELEKPEFAYLSACHTTVGDEESPDEVIHLASAMQFAGFRSVIGTMWAVDDGQTNKIASKFYENLMDGSAHLDHTRAALALRRTMRSLASSVPLDQRILYVHIGA